MLIGMNIVSSYVKLCWSISQLCKHKLTHTYTHNVNKAEVKLLWMNLTHILGVIH